MSDPFEFTVPTARVDLGGERSTSTVVDVTNRTGRRTEVGFDLRPGEGTDAAWFTAPDPANIDLADGASTRVNIGIDVPSDAPHGQGTFQLRAYALEDPQGTFATSPSITVAVPAPADDDDGPPSWLLVLVGVIVVVVIGVGAWFLLRDDGNEIPVPALIGLTEAEAEQELALAGLASERNEEAVEQLDQDGRVLDQDPAADTLVDEDRVVAYVLGVQEPTELSRPEITQPERSARRIAASTFGVRWDRLEGAVSYVVTLERCPPVREETLPDGTRRRDHRCPDPPELQRITTEGLSAGFDVSEFDLRSDERLRVSVHGVDQAGRDGPASSRTLAIS
jgi:hypothetical protein